MNIQNISEYERIQKLRHEKIYEKILDENTTIEHITTNDADPLDNEIILNMGPQHPATHGVLRVLLRINGETVVKAIPELGYLHRGMEKIAENMGLHEFIPFTDRLDYLSPLANNVAYILACENAIGIEAPPRAQ